MSSLRMDTQSQLRVKAGMFLQDRAHDLQSRVLSIMAAHVNADPFRKVKKMIKDLITKLMEEANEEAEHKGWCDTELATNEKTRKEKTEAVETLHAEIDQLEASIAKLTSDIADLSKAVGELDAAMSKATQLRGDEKEKKHGNHSRFASCSDSRRAGTHSAERVLCQGRRGNCFDSTS